ncbi:MAG: TIGR01459 family HAD-type hydrolase [Methylobacteriaceae bacterium]|nr:TIGR01459 family HAD-type hydrolase [Methylobacteriaceae bacterium]
MPDQADPAILSAPPPTLSGFAALAGRYDVVLSDVWGVVHDGVAAFPRACAALARYRAQGGVVVLITNAPRPSGPILAQLDGYGVPREAYDAVVSSGDVTLDLMAARGVAPVHFIGPPRDLTLFSELAETGAPVPPQAPLAEAEYVVCSGLYDDFAETPADYDPALDEMVRRGLDMVCANPDLVVHRGDDLLYCAGALAQRLEQKGGRAVYAGKPHPPIYEKALARARAARAGRAPEAGRVLCIGDAVRTDLAGAAAQGFDALFISYGIHRDELHEADGALRPDALAALMAAAPRPPVGVMPQLWW